MNPDFKKAAVFLLLLTILYSFSFSQTIEKKTFTTAFAKVAPEIDGLMNDSCWNQVDWGSDFIQSEPAENQQCTQRNLFLWK